MESVKKRLVWNLSVCSCLDSEHFLAVGVKNQ